MSLIKNLLILSAIAFTHVSCVYESKNHQPQSEHIIGDNGNSEYLSYLGNWHKDRYDEDNQLMSTLSLTIKHISETKIGGEYCYISRYGAKIDCESAFGGEAIGDNQYLIHFTSSFGNLEGKAILTLAPDQIIWELKEFPADLGVSVLKKATLVKQTSRQCLDLENKNGSKMSYQFKLRKECNDLNRASQLEITNLPITLRDFATCYEDYCAARYPIHDMEDLPANLREEFDLVGEPETVLRLPNINDIEVYILARNYTDVEEYGLVTFNGHIIDSMIIGIVGTEDYHSEFDFAISNAYQQIELTYNDPHKPKLYRIDDSGKIQTLY